VVAVSHTTVWKICKIAATKCHIVRIKCTKFDFCCGSAPDPVGGAYSAPSNPLTAFKGPTSNGGKEKGTAGKERKRGEKERKERGEGGGGYRREGTKRKGGEGLAYNRRLGPRMT